MDGFHAHLIGVGGNGMAALAEVLRGWGWSVSGSDLTMRGHAAENLPPETDIVIHSDAIPPENPEILRAAELGIPVLSYFQALGEITQIRTGSILVPRLCLGTHCLGGSASSDEEKSLADSRQSLSNRAFPGRAWERGGKTLAIAGTHGKSTVTAMTAHILTQSGRNPTVFCGAAPLGKTSGGRAGRRDFFVVEACEYRKNFLYLRPNHAVILGIEPDHFDCFENLAEIEAAFRQFAELPPTDGLLLFRADCATTQKVVQKLNFRTKSFGFSNSADWSAQNLLQNGGYYRFSIFKNRDFFTEVQLPVPGRFNLLNALAAAALCGENGASAEEIQHGLATFPGLRRRFEILNNLVPRLRLGTHCPGGSASAEVETSLGTPRQSLLGSVCPGRAWEREFKGETESFGRQVKNLSYVKDYAHHPTEVAAALQSVREVFPNRRIWCIFQPHQASRTAQLLDELALSLQNADKVIVAEIFRAREGLPKPGDVTAADLARRTAEIANSPHPNFLPKGEGTGIKVLPIYQTDDIIDTLATQVQNNDVIITLGAGDIHDKMCQE